MEDDTFEWDDAKADANFSKHGVTFSAARGAFKDPRRLIFRDSIHSGTEERYYCIGVIEGGVATVRFTRRHERIRIIGAGFWRKGRRLYDQEKRK